jgi:hypothetical protein
MYILWNVSIKDNTLQFEIALVLLSMGKFMERGDELTYLPCFSSQVSHFIQFSTTVNMQTRFSKTEL